METGWKYQMPEQTAFEKMCEVMEDVVHDTTWTALAGLFVFAAAFTAVALTLMIVTGAL